MIKALKNKKAHFDYEILDTFEAGLVLAGYEVKSLKLGNAKLEGAHVLIRGGEAYLVNSSIAPYQPANMPKDYEPQRVRKLLLSKKELKELEQKSEQAGLTIVPIRLYNAGRKLKLEIGIGRGKKKSDKRETLKARDNKRVIDRILKSQ
jgi:SsrA-binding protein